jgi:hypothetical protein
MKIKHIIFSAALATATLLGAGCDLADSSGTDMSDIVTEMPSDTNEKAALGPEASLCIESAGHWNKKEQHCLITETLCSQVGDWIGKSCVLPVTDCIEEGSHKEGSKCVVEYYSKEHMQTIVADTKP